ncbi:5'-nucleotidase [Massilia sp. Dwa41.01b]|uniref:5'-nucleotidase n=1 Tax=unclassified Massilia TaxID=2609279 RepID=UPI00160440C3|nr:MULTISPECIES: 5'-nucleotidase [unclassified Massilia]QNA88920.1 5'-nucleotidase [Massilia sp. Dwa41.01b]QNA99811.1 5'-nucleotidase [Massilia sp. Se16.2.3]
MPFPIEQKLVIGVASSALFDLSESHQVYLERGPEEYRAYQEQHLDTLLGKGVAFPFIRRFLNINKCFPEQSPVEVVLFSRNSPETGLRVLRSIAHYGLDISRAAFMAGKPPYPYLPAFNASLFLSANAEDVSSAIAIDYPAGLVLPSRISDEDDDLELRVAFDFDGVLADDESETVFKRNNDLDEFHAHETLHMDRPHSPGPLAKLFQQLAMMQRLEEAAQRRDPQYRRIVRIAIITARSAPSHERVVTTLKSWGVSADETFFLGGMEKSRVLSVFKPHIFFDDQMSHLRSTPGGTIPMVHVPFGVANRRVPAPAPDSAAA